MNETLIIAQMIAIVIAAVGTPGVTFWVMKKMTKQALETINNSCATHREHIESRISDLGKDIENIDERQRVLREKTLPEKYVTQKFCDVCCKERKDEDQLLHNRISEKNPGGS